MLNGVLFPGGGGDYFDKGKLVFDKIIEYNDAGLFYPMWGTCLGYEHFVAYTATNWKNALDEFIAKNVSLPLEFLVPPQKTRMFEDLGDKAYMFEQKNMTYNFHQWAVAPDMYKNDTGLNTFWDVTSQSRIPNNGTAFVATIEAKNYPIYAT